MFKSIQFLISYNDKFDCLVGSSRDDRKISFEQIDFDYEQKIAKNVKRDLRGWEEESLAWN